MITIKNEQDSIRFDVFAVERSIQKMLDVIRYSDFDIGVLFTTDEGIQSYNKKYRQIDKPTDVLSFPYHTDLSPGERVVVSEGEDKNLGDIIISAETVKRDAESEGRSPEEHVLILLAHGIAHLVGYDHQTDEEYQQMVEKERELVAAVRKN